MHSDKIRYGRLAVDSLKSLTNLAETRYFRHIHDANVIFFCEMLKSRESVLFSMDLDTWSQEAFSLGHISDANAQAFLNLCRDIKDGKKDISATFESSLAYNTADICPCRFDATTIYEENVPWQTIGCITSQSTVHSAKESDSSIDEYSV